MSLYLFACSLLLNILQLFIILSGIALLALIALRLWVEPKKGFCTSKATLHGRVALITGGNSGLGLETARDLARRGAKVIIASRNDKKSAAAVEDIIKTTGNEQVEYKHLDLSKFSSVRKFAEDFNKSYEHLHILVNNAGCAGLKNRPSEDGIDMVMQVNYFGPFLLTNLLLDKLKASQPSRIVIVSSFLHWFGNVTEDTIDGRNNKYFWRSYYDSKLCDVLWTRALAKRLPPGVTVNSLHPGIVQTDIYKRVTFGFEKLIIFLIGVFFKTAEEGIQTIVHLCVSEELENVSGQYFQDCKLGGVNVLVNDDTLVEKVWNRSLLLTAPSKSKNM